MDFSNMPPAMQFGLAIASGVGVLAALGALVHFDPIFMIIIALGIILVGLLLLGFRFLLRLRQKRKSAPLEQGLAAKCSIKADHVGQQPVCDLSACLRHYHNVRAGHRGQAL